MIIQKAAFWLVALISGLITQSALAQDFQLAPNYHMVMGPPRLVNATLTMKVSAPELEVLRWRLAIAKPPAWPPGQSRATVRVEIPGCSDLLISEIKDTYFPGVERAFYLVKFPALTEAPREFTVKLHYSASLRERRIRPGRPILPVEPLSVAQREMGLASTVNIDWQNPSFLAWMRRIGAVRQEGESELQFATRTFLLFKRNFGQGPMRHTKISEIVADGKSDCGGQTMVFIGLLRANNIPAFARFGWHVDLSGEAAACKHVRAEVYLQGIGYVPVECASPSTGSDADLLAWFGWDDGNILTVHMDPSLNLVINSKAETGLREIAHTLSWVQEPSYWVDFRGGNPTSTITTTWKVHKGVVASVEN